MSLLHMDGTMILQWIHIQHLCDGTLYKFISLQKTFLCNFSNRVVGFIVANYISCDTVRWFSHFQKLENTSRR